MIELVITIGGVYKNNHRLNSLKEAKKYLKVLRLTLGEDVSIRYNIYIKNG